MDYIHVAEIASPLREPLRRTLHGEAAGWPSLSDADVLALQEHGLVPLLFERAHLAPLRLIALSAFAAEPLRLEDLRAVLTALAERGVKALVLKGTALAYELYPQPELRPRADTDLLIDAGDLEATRAAFATLAFDEQLTSGDAHAIRQHAFTRRGRFGVEHAYDVHLAVANSPVVADVLTFEEAMRDARALPAIAPHALGLSHVQALLLACVHRVAHHHDSDRLIWLYDIHLLRERMTREEHAAFWKLASERRVLAICRRSVELAEGWFGSGAHDGAEEFLDAAALAAPEPSQRYLDRELTRGALMLTEFGALPWRARVQRLWHLAFPPAAFMQQNFGTRSRLALPWLYVWRGIRGIARLFRRVGA